MEIVEKIEQSDVIDGLRVIIAVGGNKGMAISHCEQWFDTIVNSLNKYDIFIEKTSRLWRSNAWPNRSDPDFVNAIIIARAYCTAHKLLEDVLSLEHHYGRVRHLPNEPRPLDLDLIDFNGQIITEDSLILPHPRAHERGFVMGPLCDVWPDWVHPVLQKTAQDLWSSVSIGADASPLGLPLRSK